MFPLYKITTAAQNEINAEPQVDFAADNDAYVVTESLVSFGTTGATESVSLTLAAPTGDYDKVGFVVTFVYAEAAVQDLEITAPNAADEDDSVISLTTFGDSATFMWNGTFWQTVASNVQAS